MQLFFDERQLAHAPRQYMVAGRIVAPLEVPDRAATMRDALVIAGLVTADVAEAGPAPILAVHDAGYVAFLERAHAAFITLPNAGAEVLPNVHPYRAAGEDFTGRGPRRVTGIVGQAGWYVGDMSCAIGAGTFEGAYWSAQTAVAAARAVAEGAPRAFALCRPPGHHAYVDRASGFCFFNNAAIATEVLRARFVKIAILDFDTHHGDGTQAIYYRRGDTFFASVHTDPAGYYPWYVGYADETGAGEGDGTTLNLPLAPGADDAAYLAAVERLAEAIARWGADALVVSAGWDAHREDPLSKLAVTDAAYPRLGRIVRGLGLPTVIVQEGGYSLAAIARAAPSFAAELS